MGIVEDIKSLRIQGATNIAVYSLEYLKKFSDKHGFRKKFNSEMNKLLKVRSTGVVLYNVVEILKKEKSKNKINQLLEQIKTSKEKVAENGEKLIKNNYQVYTHCHSSQAIAVIKEASKKKRFSVVVDVTEPKHQGIKTAKELSKIKSIKVNLITDDAAGVALSHQFLKESDIVIVGADAIRKEGVVNKIGTYLIALAAHENKIPFYFATITLKIDKRKKFHIELRNPSEVCKKIKNVNIINPAFDITPFKYVKGFITEKGILSVNKIKKMLKNA